MSICTIFSHSFSLYLTLTFPAFMRLCLCVYVFAGVYAGVRVCVEVSVYDVRASRTFTAL